MGPVFILAVWFILGEMGNGVNGNLCQQFKDDGYTVVDYMEGCLIQIDQIDNQSVNESIMGDNGTFDKDAAMLVCAEVALGTLPLLKERGEDRVAMIFDYDDWWTPLGLTVNNVDGNYVNVTWDDMSQEIINLHKEYDDEDDTWFKTWTNPSTTGHTYMVARTEENNDIIWETTEKPPYIKLFCQHDPNNTVTLPPPSTSITAEMISQTEQSPIPQTEQTPQPEDKTELPLHDDTTSYASIPRISSVLFTMTQVNALIIAVVVNG